MTETIFICPICSDKLTVEAKLYRCANNHIFDRARQGYVNLLPANQKNSKDPGDNKEMVRNRYQFLKTGHYAGIANALAKLITHKIPANLNIPIHIADIGCGEGYYLQQLQNQITEHTSCRYYGIDISKEAIKFAAAMHKKITWLVASGIKLPFLAQSLDIITAVFAPYSFSELHRVLQSTGRLILCTPQADHLLELRNILFDNIELKDKNSLLIKASKYFELEESYDLNFLCKLTTKEEISSLLKMTPFFFKSSPNQHAQLLALEELAITVAVKLWCFKPKTLEK